MDKKNSQVFSAVAVPMSVAVVVVMVVVTITKTLQISRRPHLTTRSGRIKRKNKKIEVLKIKPPRIMKMFVIGVA